MGGGGKGHAVPCHCRRGQILWDRRPAMGWNDVPRDVITVQVDPAATSIGVFLLDPYRDGLLLNRLLGVSRRPSHLIQIACLLVGF